MVSIQAIFDFCLNFKLFMSHSFTTATDDTEMTTFKEDLTTMPSVELPSTSIEMLPPTEKALKAEAKPILASMPSSPCSTEGAFANPGDESTFIECK